MSVKIPGKTAVTSNVPDELHSRVRIAMIHRRKEGLNWEMVLEEALKLWADTMEKSSKRGRS